MVQEVSATPGRRERNRLARHAEYLQVALQIATDEGIGAVTMQRLAAEVGAAVGTIYTYFPSKGALVAEVQREAIDRLTLSYLLLRPAIDECVADVDPSVAALAHVAGFARWSISAMDTLPQEQRLLQQLVYDAEELVPTEEGARVLPAVLRLLDLARQCFARAEEVGALRPGDAMERTVVLAASLNGVLQISKLARWDADLLDGGRLARTMLDDLLRGAGADGSLLARAHEVLDAIASRRPLAQPVPTPGASA